MNKFKRFKETEYMVFCDFIKQFEFLEEYSRCKAATLEQIDNFKEIIEEIKKETRPDLAEETRTKWLTIRRRQLVEMITLRGVIDWDYRQSEDYMSLDVLKQGFAIPNNDEAEDRLKNLFFNALDDIDEIRSRVNRKKAESGKKQLKLRDMISAGLLFILLTNTLTPRDKVKNFIDKGGVLSEKHFKLGVTLNKRALYKGQRFMSELRAEERDLDNQIASYRELLGFVNHGTGTVDIKMLTKGVGVYYALIADVIYGTLCRLQEKGLKIKT